MMQHRSQHNIEVKTAKPLPKGIPAQWFNTVRDHGPNGIIAETGLLQGRELVNTKLYCIKGENGYHYVVPISRDLEEAEADAIAEAWNAAYPDGDFVINWSQRDGRETKLQQVQQDMLAGIAESAAKTYHNQWHQRKMDEGWSFGHKMDPKARKHPMLQPWDNLSEEFRVQDRERFATLLKVLEGMNLKISQR